QNGQDSVVGPSTKEKDLGLKRKLNLPSPAFSVALPLPRASAAFLGPTSSISTASPFPFFFLSSPTAFITRCR
ncbi:unnamed protein product, partial [Musa acuminata subsp. burmannicoides]